jgi:hypothetical protein
MSERNGHHMRNVVAPAGKIERLEVSHKREIKFVTEVRGSDTKRYKYMSGDAEEQSSRCTFLGSPRARWWVLDLNRVGGHTRVSDVSADLSAMNTPISVRSPKGSAMPFKPDFARKTLSPSAHTPRVRTHLEETIAAQRLSQVLPRRWIVRADIYFDRSEQQFEQ